jgi:hypothetical protein
MARGDRHLRYFLPPYYNGARTYLSVATFRGSVSGVEGGFLHLLRKDPLYGAQSGLPNSRLRFSRLALAGEKQGRIARSAIGYIAEEARHVFKTDRRRKPRDHAPCEGGHEELSGIYFTFPSCKDRHSARRHPQRGEQQLLSGLAVQLAPGGPEGNLAGPASDA